MHLKDSNKLPDYHFKRLPTYLVRWVPSFYSELEKDEVYQIIFDFTTFLIKNSNDKMLLEQTCHFINEVTSFKEKMTDEVIGLQFFQILEQENPDLLKALSVKLSSQSVEVYREFKE